MTRILAVLAFLIPSFAQALSCMPHSIEGVYKQAQASKARYLVVRGVLRFDESKLPKGNGEKDSQTPPITKIKGSLSGKAFTGKRFSSPFNHPITLEVGCIGPWCAGAKSDAEVIAFVRKDGDKYVVATDACGGFLFQHPRPDMLRALKQCHAGGKCVPKDY